MPQIRFVQGVVAIAFMSFAGTRDAIGKNAGSAGAATGGPETIRQQQPDFLVRADVDHASRCYHEGDKLSLRVTSEVDAYLYVIYRQADGKIYQIFPNSGQPDNLVRAQQPVQVPGADDLFRWEIGPPFGKELIKVIASKAPLKPLADPALRQSRFNPLSARQLQDTKEKLAEQKPAVWAEHQIEITTVAGKVEATGEPSRRFGVFFGASRFEFNAEAKEAAKGKWEPDRDGNANGANTVGSLMRERGRLTDLRVYTDQQATRPQLEQAITAWLPSVSRPGDTAFIYIACHGDRFLDPNQSGDRQKYTYYLLLHDYCDPGILKVLLQQRAAGRLDPSRESRVNAWSDIVSKSNSNREAWAAMCRATCVTDQLFGHWLQRIDGRQVVVILDACHSAGFSPDAKGFGEGEGAFAFNFLEGQLPRLKDIGQADTVLYSACSANQVEYTHRVSDRELARMKASIKGFGAAELETQFTVMTYYIVDSLLQMPAPMTIEDCRQWCTDGMHRYFTTYNAIAAKKGWKPLVEHQPQLFNYATRPVYMKP